jgi:hypothetical protein
MERHSTAADGTPWRHATHFSYDVHGNVKTIVQENPQMPAGHRTKTIEYEYDLVSGQVDEVRYQPGRSDQFSHRYRYDADERLVSVDTSTDGVHWDRDAAYTYYRHGPLARLELGQERVQGIDYAYTISGQLKGVNSDSLRPERDIGKDGVYASLPPSEVARDVFGFVLGYYPGDYQPIGALSPVDSFAAQPGGAPQSPAKRRRVSGPRRGRKFLGWLEKSPGLRHRRFLRSERQHHPIDAERSEWPADRRSGVSI